MTARFATTPIGAGLAALDGGLTLTTTVGAANLARTARSDIAPGASIVATTGAGGALGGNAATATVQRFADGTLGAWIVTGGTVATSTVKIAIGATGQVDIGEIVALPAVTCPASDGWQIGTIDPSPVNRTRGAQVNVARQTAYRVLSASLAGMTVPSVRGGALENGMDLEQLAAALRGAARCCAIPHYRDVDTKAMDYALANRTAIYGIATTIPDASNVQRGVFRGQIVVEEVPAL